MIKKSLIITILVIIVILVGGFLLWKVYINDKETKNNNQTNSNIETVNWKTYTNNEYGFEIKYPKDWGVGGDTENYVHFTPIDNSWAEGLEIVTRNKKPFYGIKTTFNNPDIIDFKDTLIAGQKANHVGIPERIEDPYAYKFSDIYLFDKDENGYYITIKRDALDGDNVGEKILSTFKFTK